MWVNNKFVLLLYLHTTHYIGIPFFDRRTTELYLFKSFFDWLRLPLTALHACLSVDLDQEGVCRTMAVCASISHWWGQIEYDMCEYDINIVHVPPFLITSSSPGFVLSKYKMASNGSTHCPAWVVLLDRKWGTIEGEFYSRIFFLYLSPLC